MGTNTLLFKKSGRDQYDLNGINQFRTALDGDIVSRTKTGTLVNNAKDFGLSGTVFNNGYISNLIIGDPSNNNKIEEDSGKIALKTNNIKRKEVTENYLTQSASPGQGGIAVSSAINYSTTSTSYSGAVTVTLVVSGLRPVLLFLAPDGVGESSFMIEYTAASAGNKNTSSAAQFTLGGVKLVEQFLNTTIMSLSAGGDQHSKPVSSFSHIHFPSSSGSKVYGIQIKRDTANTTFTLNNCLLVAMEL